MLFHISPAHDRARVHHIDSSHDSHTVIVVLICFFCWNFLILLFFLFVCLLACYYCVYIFCVCVRVCKCLLQLFYIQFKIYLILQGNVWFFALWMCAALQGMSLAREDNLVLQQHIPQRSCWNWNYGCGKYILFLRRIYVLCLTQQVSQLKD